MSGDILLSAVMEVCPGVAQGSVYILQINPDMTNRTFAEPWPMLCPAGVRKAVQRLLDNVHTADSAHARVWGGRG